MSKNKLAGIIIACIAVIIVVIVTTTCTPNDEKNNPAGDIPDSQVFVTYKPASGNFEVKVPEGWAQSTSESSTEFTDKLNIVSVNSVPDAPEPTVERAKSVDAQELASTEPAFQLVETKQVTLPGGKAILIKYQKTAHQTRSPERSTGWMCSFTSSIETGSRST